MVLPQGRKGEQGAVDRTGVHGVVLADGRFYPVQYLDGGLVVSGNKGALFQDDCGGSLLAVSPPVHWVHLGLMYQAWVINLALANNGTLIMSTPDPIGMEVHFTFEGVCGGDATLELLEDPTIADGAAIPAWNMNRNVADPAFQPFQDPTLGGAPNVLSYSILPGGQGPRAGGGSASSRIGLEWITDAASIYAIRLTNISGNVQPASIVVNFSPVVC